MRRGDALGMRRFTPLTNGFREAGLTINVWTLEELIALLEEPQNLMFKPKQELDKVFCLQYDTSTHSLCHKYLGRNLDIGIKRYEPINATGWRRYATLAGPNGPAPDAFLLLLFQGAFSAWRG